MGGYYNTALGTYAGYAMSGMSNIAMGTYAGTSMSTGNNNLYLGSYASGVLARDHQFSIGNVLYGQGMGTG